ncbi:MAG TPA: Hsp20/alpha crystallin family protein [Allocoleopsis sp.]
MAIVKFNPAFNRYNTLDRFFNDVFNTPIFNDEVKLTTPSVNVIENGEAFKLEVAAPGLTKEDFKINVDDKVLTISAEKKTEKETKDGEKYVRREFGYSAFKRSFTLPENVKPEDIKATYENGVLNINLPKAEVKKLVQTIEIQ